MFTLLIIIGCLTAMAMPSMIITAVLAYQKNNAAARKICHILCIVCSIILALNLLFGNIPSLFGIIVIYCSWKISNRTRWIHRKKVSQYSNPTILDTD